MSAVLSGSASSIVVCSGSGLGVVVGVSDVWIASFCNK